MTEKKYQNGKRSGSPRNKNNVHYGTYSKKNNFEEDTIMNEKVKCGLGVSGILGVGAALGIGAKALGTKIIAKIKEKKAEKKTEKVSNEK